MCFLFSALLDSILVSPSPSSSLQDYFKNGVINCPPSVSVAELHEACDYFLIPFDASTIKCHNLRKSIQLRADLIWLTLILFVFRLAFCSRSLVSLEPFWNTGGLLHEISNEGAKEQFEKFLDEQILPEMVKAAKVSSRDAGVCRLTDHSPAWANLSPERRSRMPYSDLARRWCGRLGRGVSTANGRRILAE